MSLFCGSPGKRVGSGNSSKFQVVVGVRKLKMQQAVAAQEEKTLRQIQVLNIV